MKREDRPASSLRRDYRPKGALTPRAERVWSLHKEGVSRSAIAERLGLALGTVDRYIADARSAERG